MKIKITGLDKKVNSLYLSRMMQNEHPLQIYYGGSSSSKSYSQAQKTVLRVFQQRRNYLVIRQVKDTIRKSVYNEIKDKIYDLRLRQYFTFNKSELVIHCVNGAQILFAGLDDVEKIKSIKPEHGILTDIWIEEATETTRLSFKQLKKRLRGLTDIELVKTITMTFNPIMKDHWIFKDFFGAWWKDIFTYATEGNELELLSSEQYKKDLQYQEHGDVSILHTTFFDNKYLTEQDTRELLNEEDKYHFEVYTLGKGGVLGAVIYKNYKIESFNKKQFGEYRHGVDWGFSNDPFAYVKFSIDLTRKKIYICEEVYQRELSNYASAQIIKPHCESNIVWCDCAEPKSVDEFLNFDINAVSVKKGMGSVENGIKYLKSFEIIIHPDCPNFANEIKTYKFKEAKTGEVLPKPADRQADHLLDALRYGVEEIIGLGEPTLTIL